MNTIEEQMNKQMGRNSKPKPQRIPPVVVALISTAIMIYLFCHTSITIIPAKQIGIVEKRDTGIVMEEILQPGFHFKLFGLFNDKVYIVDRIKIPFGYMGTVTHRDTGQYKKTIQPGIYQINTQLYTVKLQARLEIPINCIGVATSKVSGINLHILTPGYHYIDTSKFDIEIIEKKYPRYSYYIKLLK